MLDELLQTADWKTEKHVPVMDAPETAKPDEVFEVNVSLGRVELSSHGASTDGPDGSGVYTHHGCTFHMRTAHPGELMAMAHCNIHGLWQSSAKLSLK